MSEAGSPKRMGRPRKYPSGEKRPTLTFRVRGDMHRRLEESASAAGRSLSEEIEHRLGASFEDDDEKQRLVDALSFLLRGGNHTTVVLVDIANAVRQLEETNQIRWMDPDCDLKPFNVNLAEILFAHREAEKNRRLEREARQHRETLARLLVELPLRNSFEGWKDALLTKHEAENPKPSKEPEE